MSKDVNAAPEAFKPKKSVALSGTPAGSTALCTVGHSGNDLHYRGYDIKDLAAHCEFEEVALSAGAWQAAQCSRTCGVQGQPAATAQFAGGSEAGAGTAACHHASDGRAADGRVGSWVRAAGGRKPTMTSGARTIADTLLACLGSMLPLLASLTRAMAGGSNVEAV